MNKPGNSCEKCEMRHLFFRILLFLIPVIASGIIIEALLRQIPNDYTLKREYLDKNSDSVQVLVLGSSHSIHGINPALMSKRSFNAANWSQSLDYDLEILKRYSNKWSSLQYVILPVSYQTLFEKLEDSIEDWRVKNYIIYFKIRTSNYIPYYAEILNGQFSSHLFRLYNYIFKSKDDILCSELGWPTFYSQEISRDLFKTGIESAKRNTLPIDKQHFTEMTSALDSIISFTSRLDCKLILVTMPAYKSFRDNLDQNQWGRTLERISETLKDCGNCYYYNMISDESFTENDFFDGDHLNNVGASKFTLKMDSIIDYISCRNMIR